MDAEASNDGFVFSKIGLATERLCAIDLSCRACGAGAGREPGLGFPVGASAALRFSPPTSDLLAEKRRMSGRDVWVDHAGYRG